MDHSIPTQQPPRSSADYIAQQIATRAASVRQTFEDIPARKKHAVSSTTAAAAHHMASLNRRRKFEKDMALQALAGQHGVSLPLPQPEQSIKPMSHKFHSRITSFTRQGPERARPSVSSAIVNVPTTAARPKQPTTRVTDGIVLKSTPHDITVSYNDVVCSKGKTTSTLVGNQRHKVWISLHKEEFAKAFNVDHRRKIACKVVNAVTTSVPQGRFLSLDIHTGLWYDVGYDRAVGITLELLMAEAGMMRAHPPVARKATKPRVLTSKAA